MKMYWSAIFSLLLLMLMGCGKEQFGTASQKETNTINAPQNLKQTQCFATSTLIQPKVDIVYVVDNSFSTVYLSQDIKNAIKNTVDTVSQQFDTRVIVTKLISTNHQDYQVFANSADLAGLPPVGDTRRVTSSSGFTFFGDPASGMEEGLSRVHGFMSFHSNGLIRRGAHHIVVLISNGNDETVEQAAGNAQPMVHCQNGSTVYPPCPGPSVFDARKSSFVSLRSNLESLQLRMFSVTAPAGICDRSQELLGWRASENSYRRMSLELYNESGATDSSTQDRFNLCGGALSTIFASVNQAIQQVRIPHVYNFWPITFAETNSNASLDVNDMVVTKITSSGSSPLASPTHWSLVDRGSVVSQNLRLLPTPGEPVSGRYFIQFAPSSYITWPDCVTISSKTKKEYFGWIVIPRNPVPSSIVVRINGQNIPQSSSNGWSYTTAGQPMTRNIKIPDPTTGEVGSPVIKSGFMIQLHGRYYMSGDNVEVFYTPAAI
jgi:hypothetical protein